MNLEVVEKVAIISQKIQSNLKYEVQIFNLPSKFVATYGTKYSNLSICPFDAMIETPTDFIFNFLKNFHFGLLPEYFQVKQH